ncbi:hypothetical protein J422_02794 [Methanocaldococcus villosus KIN24-T80]|uniref:Uncharacterized protein n=1 Tax=Methanocaldococcus villosus KIN24-T80 TaxID=1069083 RepID=N6UVJ3_9EURY|nr:hypothetical protein [Methanocaldococcus villosus]ENN96369.1 hypothetical protein J422_02794 [Methanocaldococcus villosus KIN24-T80]
MKDDWIENLLKDLNKSKSNDILIDEIINKLDSLISEINSYIAEIQYGLSITNEKINSSILELNKLENNLKNYMAVAEDIRESFENTYNTLIDIKGEIDNIRASIENSSNQMTRKYKNIENIISGYNKRIEMLDKYIKEIIKTQKNIINNLNTTRSLVYATILLTIINMLILLKITIFG